MATSARIPTFGCRVVAAYPHDPLAFTQGLLWHRGALYESTGLIGHSTVRKIRNLSDSEDAVYVVVGGKDGYVGRDGALPEDETSR